LSSQTQRRGGKRVVEVCVVEGEEMVGSKEGR
jgi:hypothetical protein